MVQHHFGLFWRKIKPLGLKINAVDVQWRHLEALAGVGGRGCHAVPILRTRLARREKRAVGRSLDLHFYVFGLQ